MDVAYDIINRRLYAATIHAAYLIPSDGRVPVRIAGCERAVAGLGSPGPGYGSASGAGSGSGPGAAGAAAGSASGATSGGPGSTSREFSGISGLVADADGGLLITDRHQVFRLEADGGPEAVICLGKGDTQWGGIGEREGRCASVCSYVVRHNGAAPASYGEIAPGKESSMRFRKTSRNHPVMSMLMASSRAAARFETLAAIAVPLAANRMDCLPRPCRLTPQCCACSRTQKTPPRRPTRAHNALKSAV